MSYVLTAEETMSANDQPLPADIEMVWGNDPTMAKLVSAWGVEAFRKSALHALAVNELEHTERKRAQQKIFLAKVEKGKAA